VEEDDTNRIMPYIMCFFFEELIEHYRSNFIKKICCNSISQNFAVELTMYLALLLKKCAHC